MEWLYREKWIIGYEIWKNPMTNPKKNINEPIRWRKVLKNELSQPQISLENENGIRCPSQIGVDVIVRPEIGVALYAILQAYLAAPITTSFYAILPEFRREYIRPKPAEPFNFCQNGVWGASLWYQVDIEVQLGGRVALKEIPGIAMWLVTGSWGASNLDTYMTSLVVYSASNI